MNETFYLEKYSTWSVGLNDGAYVLFNRTKDSRLATTKHEIKMVEMWATFNAEKYKGLVENERRYNR